MSKVQVMRRKFANVVLEFARAQPPFPNDKYLSLSANTASTDANGSVLLLQLRVVGSIWDESKETITPNGWKQGLRIDPLQAVPLFARGALIGGFSRHKSRFSFDGTSASEQTFVNITDKLNELSLDFRPILPIASCCSKMSE